MSARRLMLALVAALAVLAIPGCDDVREPTFQGWVEAELIFVGPDETGRGTYGAQARPTASLLSGVAYNGGVANVGPAERAQAITDVRYWRAAIVVLAPDAPHGDDLHATLDALFGPGTRVADVWLWDVRRLL